MNAINDNGPQQRRQIPAAQPFRTPEAAWFWTMGVLVARRDGVGASFGTQRQVCEPDDVVMTLDRLYRQRRVDLAHARILRVYGERGTPPASVHTMPVPTQAMQLNQMGCALTDQQARDAVCTPVADCAQVAELLLDGLPADVTVAAQAISGGSSGQRCTLALADGSASAGFIGIATGQR